MLAQARLANTHRFKTPGLLHEETMHFSMCNRIRSFLVGIVHHPTSYVPMQPVHFFFVYLARDASLAPATQSTHAYAGKSVGDKIHHCGPFPCSEGYRVGVVAQHIRDNPNKSIFQSGIPKAGLGNTRHDCTSHHHRMVQRLATHLQ